MVAYHSVAVEGARCRASTSESRVRGVGMRVGGLGFRDEGFRVWGAPPTQRHRETNTPSFITYTANHIGPLV